ncbi:MAG: DM13 domain-containing protein [Bacteroidetes bacterium]|nr:DM13 domain-containing protein [Bacteroidota bacterium]
MKKILALFCLGLFLINCSKDDDPITEKVVEEMEEVVVEMTSNVMGDFVSLAHPTSGKASVSKDGLTLTFTNFKTDSGPKLLVYLSTDNSATSYVNLGDLKGIEGDFTYAIPAGTDFGKYKIVNIWCVDFSVSFGVAELKK